MREPSDILSAEDRARIQVMAGYGMSLEDMAGVLGISLTMLRHAQKFGDLAEVIATGRSRGIFQVKQKAFEMAKSGEHPQMTMFWLKTVEGWTEVEAREFPKLAAVKKEERAKVK